MAEVFDVDIRELASKLQKGKEYSIYTLYRDVPVNIKATLSWIDFSKAKDVYLAFNWKNASMKYAFQSKNPIYVKITIGDKGKELLFYIKCDFFSGMKDELVLLAKSLVEVPPFLKRSSVRVEINKNKHKAYARLCLEKPDDHNEEVCFPELTLKNLSEHGFAIEIQKNQDSDANAEVLEKIRDLASKDSTFLVELYVDGTLINAKANVVNIYEEDEAIYAGFKMTIDKRDAQKLSNAIMKLQQEIIQEIRSI